MIPITQTIKLSDLKPNTNNPRFIRDEKFKKLVKSIQEFPQMLELRPIIVDADYTILGGNMRYMACKDLRIKEVPVIVADELTEQQALEFIIKDNVGFGEWEWDILANEWDENELVEWGLDLPFIEMNEEVPDDPDPTGIKIEFEDGEEFQKAEGEIHNFLKQYKLKSYKIV